MVNRRSFLEYKKLWRMLDERNDAQRFRDKFCGDCVHHRETQPCNSGSYTNCSITNASVGFGTKCNCGKFLLWDMK